jgi:hypothetical protein
MKVPDEDSDESRVRGIAIKDRNKQGSRICICDFLFPRDW